MLFDVHSLTWGFMFEGSSFMPWVEVSINAVQLFPAALIYILTIIKWLCIVSELASSHEHILEKNVSSKEWV